MPRWTMSTPDTDNRPKSIDLTPGTVIRFADGKTYTLDRRKDPAEHPVRKGRGAHPPFFPGWWLVDGGGFADDVLDEKDRHWHVVSLGACDCGKPGTLRFGVTVCDACWAEFKEWRAQRRAGKGEV